MQRLRVKLRKASRPSTTSKSPTTGEGKGSRSTAATDPSPAPPRPARPSTRSSSSTRTSSAGGGDGSAERPASGAAAAALLPRPSQVLRRGSGGGGQAADAEVTGSAGGPSLQQLEQGRGSQRPGRRRAGWGGPSLLLGPEPELSEELWQAGLLAVVAGRQIDDWAGRPLEALWGRPRMEGCVQPPARVNVVCGACQGGLGPTCWVPTTAAAAMAAGARHPRRLGTHARPRRRRGQQHGRAAQA